MPLRSLCSAAIDPLLSFVIFQRVPALQRMLPIESQH